jgi:hypothetical protein
MEVLRSVNPDNMTYVAANSHMFSSTSCTLQRLEMRGQAHAREQTITNLTISL